jgi:hypothetical protein
MTLFFDSIFISKYIFQPTNSMELIYFQESNGRPSNHESHAHMKFGGSLFCSQKPVTGPYPDLGQFRTHPHTHPF